MNPQHGTRAHYFSKKCRCDACRRANTEYQRSRRRGEFRFVDPAPIRKHLRWLQRHDIGRRAIAAATDLADTNIWRILRGDRKKVQARVAKKLMAVDTGVIDDRALVPSALARSLLKELVEDGFSKKELARMLGSKAVVPQLQVGVRGRIEAGNEFKIIKLYKKLTGNIPAKNDVIPQRDLEIVRALGAGERSATQIANEHDLTVRTIERLKKKYLVHPMEDRLG